MTTPIILVVHENARDRETLERELADRYSSAYEIIGDASPLSALERLKALRAAGDTLVFIMFASERVGAMSGTEFFERAHRLYPHAQRVLLVPRSNRSASKPLLRMITQRTLRPVHASPKWIGGRGFPLPGHRASPGQAAAAS